MCRLRASSRSRARISANLKRQRSCSLDRNSTPQASSSSLPLQPPIRWLCLAVKVSGKIFLQSCSSDSSLGGGCAVVSRGELKGAGSPRGAACAAASSRDAVPLVLGGGAA